jgi:hypothetical protein
LDFEVAGFLGIVAAAQEFECLWMNVDDNTMRTERG